MAEPASADVWARGLQMSVAENLAVDEYIMDALGARIHREWIGAERQRTYRSKFLTEGYFLLPMDAARRDLLLRCFDPKNRIELKQDDCGPGHWPSAATAPGIIAELNAKHNFYSAPDTAAQRHLETFLEANRGLLEAQLGSPFEICNVRIDELLPSNAYGPSQWHTDGGPRFLRKILLYPGPLKRDVFGALEFFDRKGRRHVLESDGPVAALFEASFLMHRGYPPRQDKRGMIEITLKPSRVTVTRPVFPGHLARVPRVDDETLSPELRALKAKCLEPDSRQPPIAAGTTHRRTAKRFGHIRSLGQLRAAVYRRFARLGFVGKYDDVAYGPEPLPYVSGQVANKCAWAALGGGADFRHAGWQNVDDRDHSQVHSPIAITPNLVVPMATGSVSLVYSPFFFDRFDDETVSAMLEESRRILDLDGDLLVVFPDFSRMLTERTIEEIASLICSYTRTVTHADRGEQPSIPASVSKELESLIAVRDVHGVAKILSKQALKDPAFDQFERQNAWTRAQFVEILQRHGFEPDCTDRRKVLKRFGWVPDFNRHQYGSMIVLARCA